MDGSHFKQASISTETLSADSFQASLRKEKNILHARMEIEQESRITEKKSLQRRTRSGGFPVLCFMHSFCHFSSFNTRQMESITKQMTRNNGSPKILQASKELQNEISFSLLFHSSFQAVEIL